MAVSLDDPHVPDVADADELVADREDEGQAGLPGPAALAEAHLGPLDAGGAQHAQPRRVDGRIGLEARPLRRGGSRAQERTPGSPRCRPRMPCYASCPVSHSRVWLPFAAISEGMFARLSSLFPEHLWTTRRAGSDWGLINYGTTGPLAEAGRLHVGLFRLTGDPYCAIVN